MKKILCMMLAIMLISSTALTGCGNKKGIEKKASSENGVLPVKRTVKNNK